MDQPIQQQTPAPTINTQPSLMKRTFTPKFILVLLGIIVLGSAAYGYVWWMGKQSAETVIPTYTPRTEDPTASWKTYTNTEYGFSFKYPGEYENGATVDGFPDLNLGEGEITFVISSNLVSGNVVHHDYFGELNNPDIDEVGGSPAYKFKIPKYCEGYITFIPIPSKSIEISLDNCFVGHAIDKNFPNSRISLYNQILSTFKFIDNAITDCGTINADVTSVSVTTDSSGGSGTASVSYDPDSAAAKSCFGQKFSQCQRARMITSSGAFGSYYYEIIGPNGNYCFVKSKFLTNQNPDWINKEMLCSLNPKKDFDTAIQDLSHCAGELYNLMTGK